MNAEVGLGRTLFYDEQGVIGTSVETDLDLLRFELEYLPRAVSSEVLEENDRESIEKLRALRLVTQDGVPTVTAILMLGKEPQYWFPGAYIQFVRYEGEGVTDPIKNQKELRGTLSDQLDELDKIFSANIAVALNTSGTTHKKEPDYPIWALKEVARNAVIHRNYEGSNSPVRVNWFSSYIEIISPGTAYGEVTKANFGKGTVAYRNPTIAEALKNMGFMERFGRGIAIAQKALADNNNPPLEFDIQDTTILVRIKPRS